MALTRRWTQPSSLQPGWCVVSRLPYTSGSREISEDDHMQAVLKGLHSIDITDLENYAPQEDDNFGFVLRAMVGPMDGKGKNPSTSPSALPDGSMKSIGFPMFAWAAQINRLQIRLPSAAPIH